MTKVVPTDGEAVSVSVLEPKTPVAVSTSSSLMDDSTLLADLTESLRKQQQQKHPPEPSSADKDAWKAEYEEKQRQVQEQTRDTMEQKHRAEMTALRNLLEEKEKTRKQDKASSLDDDPQDTERTAMIELLQHQITTMKQTHSDELIKRDALMQKAIQDTERSVRAEMERKLQHAKFEHRQALDQNTQQWQTRLEQTTEKAKQLLHAKQGESFDSSGSLQEELRKEREAHAAAMKSIKRELDRAKIKSNGHASEALQRLEKREKEWAAKQHEYESKSDRLTTELLTLKESTEDRNKQWEAALKTARENESLWQEKFKALQQELGRERQRLNDRIQELRSTNQTLRVRGAKLSNQVEHLETQVQASADSLVTACGAGNAMEEALAKQKESYEEEYKKIATRMTEEKTKLEDELHQAQTSLQEKESALNRARAGLEEQKQQLQFLSKRESKLHQTLQKSQKSASEWQSEIQLRDKLIERLRSDLSGRDGELASMEKRVEDAETKLKEMVPNRSVNLDYLKDVVVKYLSRPPGSSERAQLLPVLATLLKFDTADYKIIEEGKQRLSWWGSLAPTLITSPAESAGLNDSSGSNKADASNGTSV